MSEVWTQYLDGRLVDWLAGFAPLVGAGLVLGLIFMVLGWLVGFVLSVFKLTIR